MGSPNVNLLAFPCAGGSATMYLRWRRLLPQWICLVPVELPGRGVRFDERPIECLDELVARVCDEQTFVRRSCKCVAQHQHPIARSPS
jgi:surfactin synthase thioesterase subunit